MTRAPIAAAAALLLLSACGPPPQPPHTLRLEDPLYVLDLPDEWRQTGEAGALRTFTSGRLGASLAVATYKTAPGAGRTEFMARQLAEIGAQSAAMAGGEPPAVTIEKRPYGHLAAYSGKAGGEAYAAAIAVAPRGAVSLTLRSETAGPAQLRGAAEAALKGLKVGGR